MREQLEVLSTLFEFFAFALLIAVGGVVLLVLLAWLDEASRKFRLYLPSRKRRRSAIIPLTKIA